MSANAAGAGPQRTRPHAQGPASNQTAPQRTGIDQMGLGMMADHLSLLLMPDWLRTVAVERINAVATNGRAGREEWRIYARIALEESGMPAAHRSLYGVLIGMKPGSDWTQTELGRRAGLARQGASRIISDLAAWGWLDTDHQSGKPSRYHLMVPGEPPPDRVKIPQNARNGDGDSCRDSRQPPVAIRDNPVAIRDNPVANRDHIGDRETGRQRETNRGPVLRRAMRPVDNLDGLP